jgi:hypothetical protein
MYEVTRMGKSGLMLCPTALATLDLLERRQPDWSLLSGQHKVISIADLCHPSNVLPSQLLFVAKRKLEQHAYCPLEEALSFDKDQV